MKTYLFYDIETTGLNKSFDQVLHFAAIRTDLSLKEISRHDIKIKLNPDVIPAPQATITHHIGIKESQEGLCEHQALLQIHQLFNEPGTISLGYNTLGFDDEFLRLSFYRNLLPPYTHQFANQCGRMDLYPIAIMYYLYKNHVIQWPTLDGKPTLKLEHINTANQLAQGRSHHAMVDVEATVALAKLFLKESDMWDYVTGYFTKNTDQQRIESLPIFFEKNTIPHYEGLMLYGKLGATALYHAPILHLGTSIPYKNQHLWLRLDTENLQKTTPDTIAETTWVMRKKLGEPGFVLPFKERFLTHFSRERAAVMESNKQWLKDNPDIFNSIVHYHQHFRYPVVPSVDIDARLYLNSFWSDEENAFCRRFHKAKPEDKINMINTTQHTHLKTLAIRLIGRNYPELLSPPHREAFTTYLRHINAADETTSINDFKGEKKRDTKTALSDIAELRGKTTLNTEQLHLLDELEEYVNRNSRY